MQNKKGFTIIELIVVIAIIAILAAIVMVNVVQYINKSKDAQIQANLDTIKTNAGAWYADQQKGNGAYTGFDADNGYLTPKAAIEAGNIGSTATPSFTASDYCVSATLKSASGSWCVDSTGFTGANCCDTSTHKCAACS